MVGGLGVGGGVCVVGVEYIGQFFDGQSRADIVFLIYPFGCGLFDVFVIAWGVGRCFFCLETGFFGVNGWSFFRNVFPLFVEMEVIRIRQYK